MKKDLRKKLAAYTSLGGAMMIMHSSASAQILYFDPPDIIIDNTHFNLDLNNDGVYEFRFIDSEGFSNEYIYCFAKESVEILTQGNCFFYQHFPKLLHPGQIIKNNVPGDWNTFLYGSDAGFFCSKGSSCSDSVWQGKYNRFFAFRFKDQAGQNNYNYGWMRVSVGAGCQAMKINDWAYNSVPGASIVAGQTQRIGAEDMVPEESKELMVYSTAKILHIDDNFSEELLNISIWNVTGQLLHQMKTSSVSTAVDLQTLPAGMCLVNIECTHTNQAWKIVIE
ncbi:MAG: T9SS type A sorting domain-containing protein [Chitinophagales bacterium]|nr:T9SS type A sorting domain-containing protein [Chitinophagales bacterium]